MNVLVVINIPGNLYNVQKYCNENGLSDYVIQVDKVGMYCMVLLRMSDTVRRQKGL